MQFVGSDMYIGTLVSSGPLPHIEWSAMASYSCLTTRFICVEFVCVCVVCVCVCVCVQLSNLSAAAPSVRYDHGMVALNAAPYSGRQTVIVFGGVNSDIGVLSDCWQTYDGSRLLIFALCCCVCSLNE